MAEEKGRGVGGKKQDGGKTSKASGGKDPKFKDARRRK